MKTSGINHIELRVSGEDARKLVKEVAEAFSTQVQVANRSWIALVTVALVAVVPRDRPSLPFGLGEVSASSFHTVVFFVLVTLTVSFATAHAQGVRADRLGQSIVDSLAKTFQPGDIHPRDLFDMWRKPTLNRVAPLAQLFQGEHQFHSSVGKCSPKRRFFSTTYYAFLKAGSWLVYFGLPLWALGRSFLNVLAAGGVPRSIVYSAGLFAAVPLVHIALADARQTLVIFGKIWQAAGNRDKKAVREKSQAAQH